MDISKVQEMLRTNSIYDLPLKVSFYARVSSEKDEQLNSLSNQVDYYRDLITQNQHWIYIDGYIDEGISGISTKHRENFNRMIADAKEGKFDLIITKEISRFARNTLDSIKYTRELLSYGVGVFFQNDNINTLDTDGELRLTIMSSLAQDELRKLSSRIKFGQQQAIKNNVVLGNSRMFGYKKDNKRLVIDEEEAPMIRELFELYATDNYSMKQIENIFWDKGYRNHNGNKICHTTMSNTISNPKYKGYYVGNKVKVVDMFTKKQKFLPKEEWVMFKDETGKIVPAIVSEELWEKANQVLKRRSNDVKRRNGIANHPNLFTGKMYCSNCNKLYWRKETKGNAGIQSRWVCSGKITNGKDSCKSFVIYEEELNSVLLELFSVNSDSIMQYLDTYCEMYQNNVKNQSYEKQVIALQNKIELENRKKSQLLTLIAEGAITADDFKVMNENCNSVIGKHKEELLEFQKKSAKVNNVQDKIKLIKKIFKEANKKLDLKKCITKDFVNQFIDKIYLSPIDKSTMEVNVLLLTGDSLSGIVNKHNRNKRNVNKNNEYENGCSGQTSLTICPPIEPACLEVRSPL